MLVRLPSRFILVLLLLTFQYLLAIGCGQADPPEQSKPVGSTDARPADASEPAAAPGDPTPIEPDPIRDALDLALDQYRTIDQQARTVQAQALDPLIQRAAQAGDLDAAKRLTAIRDSVIAGEISLPPAPELAATWHQAARRCIPGPGRLCHRHRRLHPRPPIGSRNHAHPTTQGLSGQPALHRP